MVRVLNFDTSVSSVHYQEPYELSQDLVAKQLELLEKKYGGASKANEAALTITRAFRRSVYNLFFYLFFFRIFRIYILVSQTILVTWVLKISVLNRVKTCLPTQKTFEGQSIVNTYFLRILYCFVDMQVNFVLVFNC